MTLKQHLKDLFEYGEIYDDVDCFLNVLKYFEKYYDLSEKQSTEIYSIISNQYYQLKKQQEYDSELDDSDDSEKTDKLKVINKGKEKEVNKKCTFDDLAKSSKVNGIIIKKLLIKRQKLIDLASVESVREKKIIVLTGAIGVGKTFLRQLLARYLANKEYTVLITEKFKQIVQAIPNWKCDVVILDQTHFDQKYFINVLIQDENTKAYLFEEIKQIDFDLEQIYNVIYIRPSKEIMYQHQKERQENIRPLEKYPEKYLSDIYDEHDNNIEAIYPNHVKIENNKPLSVETLNYDDGYLLRLYSVLENGQKFFIDIIEYDIFFDIKLRDLSLLNSYLEEFRDYGSYDIINKQPFDSTKKFNFICIYFSNHQKRRKALQSLKNKIENLNEELQKIPREHDFELVGWHRLKSVWDIECESKRGPGFFSVAEHSDDYIYMIQLDIFHYNQSQPLKRYNITSLSINTSLFFEKYGNKIFYIEIGYNTGGFDWPFVLKKAKLLGISDKFSQQLLNKKSKLIYNIQETKVRVIDNDIDEQMQKYQFAGLNINNRDIKVNPMEKQTCKYFYIQDSIFINLLVWAKKTFQNELKHMLAHILKKCKLSGKIDLSYIPDDNSDNLKCMFVYVFAIKFKNDELLLSKIATKLSKLCKIDYQKRFEVMSDSSVLEEYAIDLVYYCSVDILRLQELLIKRNIVSDYMQLAKISYMLFSMMRKGIIEIVLYEGALVLEKKNSSKPVGTMGKIYGKFISQEQQIGLMPLMCKELLRQRDIAKGKMKEYKEDPVLMYWTSLSNALKLVANSIYEATGFIYSNFETDLTFLVLKDFFIRRYRTKIQTMARCQSKNIIKHELDLFVLNAKYDPTNKPVSVQDFFNSKHIEKSQGNKMVMDFIAKRNEEGREDLKPGRFYYYIITHPNSNINIGIKMRLVSEFKDTDKIDKLYYFKNLKDIYIKKLKQLKITESNEQENNSKKHKSVIQSTSKILKQPKITDYWT
ncbi:hypothetical protein C2G38_2208844 [Gigaspora rosea]|uniref:DNA-directed DNA polymerase n=1 Tax=Gigaspora rosea TaxID=44941 RepID=A0A397UL28_9GLOM|nr:hypothetical protein C2G38_2208844 [Gigaspora rosea]